MERYLSEVMGNQLILNSSPPRPLFLIYKDKTYVWHFNISDQIGLLVFGHFSKLSLICDFNF